jgi:hypothetical protein
MQPESPSYFILYLFSGVGQCVLLLLALYNLVAFINVMRSEGEGASPVAKAAWGIGCLSALVYPCAPLLSLIAVVLSRIEIGRVYRDESPLGSATPARMGSVNGGIAFLAWVLLVLGIAINTLV